MLDVPRSALGGEAVGFGAPSPERVNEALAAQLRALILTHPTFGYRRLWAMLRRRYGLAINRKAVVPVSRAPC